MVLGTVIKVPGIDETINNMALVPRVEVEGPRSYVGLAGGYIASRRDFYVLSFKGMIDYSVTSGKNKRLYTS